MASDLNRNAFVLQFNPQRLAQVVDAQAGLRSLQEVVIFDVSAGSSPASGLSFPSNTAAFRTGRCARRRTAMSR